MIVKKLACVCALCGADWLPRPTAKNPTADPRKVERCGTCKSPRWNDDDPRVIAKKSAPRPLTERQKQLAQRTVARARKVTRESKAFRTASEKEGSGPEPELELCRHRIIKVNCPICRTLK